MTSTFEYGADGLRRSMTITTPTTSTTTNYILDGQNVAQEWVDTDSDAYPLLSALPPLHVSVIDHPPFRVFALAFS